MEKQVRLLPIDKFSSMHFWDAMCIRIFGKTVKECRHEFIAGGDKIKVFSPCVDEMLGKTWMQQSFVLNVRKEDHHIHTLTSTLGLWPSLSRSADYDPEKIVFVTPAKRMSGELDYDEYTQYELSTN
ncbi:hypothetical protein HKD37_13G037178 [Glycine soja]